MNRFPIQFGFKTVFTATTAAAALLAAMHFLSPSMMALWAILSVVSSSILLYGLLID